MHAEQFAGDERISQKLDFVSTFLEKTRVISSFQTDDAKSRNAQSSCFFCSVLLDITTLSVSGSLHYVDCR